MRTVLVGGLNEQDRSGMHDAVLAVMRKEERA